MSHLQYLPTIYYDFGDGKPVPMAFILKRVLVSDNALKDKALFFTYTVHDGDTAQSIAYKLYGSAKDDYIIFLFNKMIDPYFDWPMTSDSFNRFMTEKYGIDHLYDTHHFVDPDGDWCDQWTFGARAVSNFQHEFELNEQRRQIKLIDPAYVDKMRSQIQTILSSVGDRYVNSSLSM